MLIWQFFLASLLPQKRKPIIGTNVSLMTMAMSFGTGFFVSQVTEKHVLFDKQEHSSQKCFRFDIITSTISNTI
jgi:hypothetical protein